MRALPQTATIVRHVNTRNALRLQRSIASSETFLMTTLPLIGCHGQLTIARSTNHAAPRRAYCQPRDMANKTGNEDLINLYSKQD